jgi:lipoprotein
MKKFLSLATALLLVGALAIFAGCGKGERSGVIKGNYTEPTKAELQSALDAIDTEKLLGDTEAEGWKTGMSLGANLSYEMSAAGEKMSMSFDLSHKISAESAQDALDLKGEGSLALQTNLAGEQEKYTVKTYNDMKNIYLDASAHANGENQNAKVRISIADIFDGYGDMLPIEPVGPTDAALPTDADALLKELADSGFTLAMDTSDGIKIKLTANESVFTEILEGVNGSLPSTGIPATGEYFSFSKDSYMEFYLHVGADGLLKKVTARMDLDGAFDFSGLGDAAAEALGKMTMRIKGAFELEIGEVSVSMPSDLSDYQAYN